MNTSSKAMETNRKHSMLLHKSGEEILVDKSDPCDLYNCRSPKCCSESAGTTSKRKDDNRCTAREEKQDRGHQEKELNSMDQEEEDETGMRVDNCRCFSSPGDRYIATGPVATIPNGPPTGGDGHHRQSEIDAELMHVLVTRPEIVGRPRDNIVFEGDMDLRTTFETSYEALARMRLKCWKRRQEMLLEETKRVQAEGSTEQKLAGQQRSSSSCRGDCSRVESGGQTEESDRKQQQQQAVSVDLEHQQLAECAGVGGGDNGNGNGNGNGAPKSRPTESPVRLPVELELGSPAATDRGGGSSAGARRRVDVAVQADLVAAAVSPYPGGPNQSSSSSQPQQHQLNGAHCHCHCHCHCHGCCQSIANKIDPDLTPIIVYDANMNRLERVGLRKRSKYRPSTSLRSGARGLFGDQAVDNVGGGGGGGGGETQRVADNGTGCCSHQQLRGSCQAAESIKREKRMATADGQGGAATAAALKDSICHKTISTNNREMAQNYENNTAGRPWDSQATNQTELALNGRNLKDSSQRDYLMFSDGNLPIDCKRKLRANVNMVDHIREDNICEGNQVRREGDLAPMDDDRASPDRTQSAATIGDEEGEEAADDALISRLASQEEEAALEELQMITSQVEGKNPEKAEWCIHNIRGSDKSEADKDERKSRLKRTCQQQHFDISNNNYAAKVEDSIPEGKTTTGQATEERGTRYSPQAKLQANNLFRESPDFILTTGKFMDQELQRSKNNN